jgi:predicted GNAT superfamily acetyltransferase
VVVVSERVRSAWSFSSPCKSLHGWIGGYLRDFFASVDGINAENGIDRLVFNFFHTLKITLSGFGVGLGSAKSTT